MCPMSHPFMKWLKWYSTCESAEILQSLTCDWGWIHGKLVLGSAGQIPMGIPAGTCSGSRLMDIFTCSTGTLTSVVPYVVDQLREVNYGALGILYLFNCMSEGYGALCKLFKS